MGRFHSYVLLEGDHGDHRKCGFDRQKMDSLPRKHWKMFRQICLQRHWDVDRE